MTGPYAMEILVGLCLALLFVFPTYFYVVDRHRRRRKDEEQDDETFPNLSVRERVDPRAAKRWKPK
jgi:hypothetical protein